MANDVPTRLAATGDALRVLSARVRQLIDATVAADAPAEAISAATRAVDDALALLTPHVPAVRPPRYPMGVSFDSPAELMPFDPIMGPMNPMAPPLDFAVEDGRSVGRARFGTPYEGPPGCVHGGVIALAFDQVLNVANLMAGVAGPTKRLSLRFRRPTPLNVALVFEGWVESRTEREVHSRGRLLHGTEVTVEAEGVFALLSAERMRRLITPES